DRPCTMGIAHCLWGTNNSSHQFYKIAFSTQRQHSELFSEIPIPQSGRGIHISWTTPQGWERFRGSALVAFALSIFFHGKFVVGTALSIQNPKILVVIRDPSPALRDRDFRIC